MNIDDIKRLKALTGVGLTDAKAALEEAKWDFDKALEAMRKKGITKAEKRGEREARAGVVGTYNHDGRIGVLIEVNCETDFVARNEIFSDLVKDLAMHIAASNPEFVSNDAVPADARAKAEQEFTEKTKADGKPEKMVAQIVEGMLKKYFAEKCLLDQPYIKNPDQTVEDRIKESIAVLGENIVVRRFNRIALGELAQLIKMGFPNNQLVSSDTLTKDFREAVPYISELNKKRSLGVEPNCATPENAETFRLDNTKNARIEKAKICGSCALKAECLRDGISEILHTGWVPKVRDVGFSRAGLDPVVLVEIATTIYDQGVNKYDVDDARQELDRRGLSVAMSAQYSQAS